MFVGRERERTRIDRLLQDARAGRSGALLLHGEAGIGKTALMRWAIGRASGMRVAQLARLMAMEQPAGARDPSALAEALS